MPRDKCERRKRVTLKENDYEVYVCEDGHVHVAFDKPEFKADLTIETSLEVFALGEAIMRGFDSLEGIEPTRR